MSYENVLVEKRDRIGFITLNRPHAMNTFNVPFARELNDALWAMEKDPEVRVVVIPWTDSRARPTKVQFIHLMDEHNPPLPK
jgi:enoyl-CoA hydratase/carnithine racemase